MSAAPPEITSLLRPSEHLLWSGRPDPRVLFTRADAYLVPFSVLFFGFAIFWEVSVITRAPDQVFAPIFGSAFVVAGLYILIGRFFYKAWSKRRTTYVVTDARALVITRAKVREAPVYTQPLEWRQSGTHLSLVFGTSTDRRPLNLDLENTGWIGSGTAVGVVSFFDVSDGAALRAAVDEALRDHGA